MRLFPALLALALLATPASAQKAKSVERENPWDVVTLESGAVAKIYVPNTLEPGERPGLVVSLHGTSMTPDSMLQYGSVLADRRGDVWCACRGGTQVGGGFGWDPKGDAKDVVEMTRYAIATYKVDPKRVVIHGFSGGAMIALDAASLGRSLYAGVVACSGPHLAWKRATFGGARAVAFLGEKDDQFPLSAEYKADVVTNHPNTCFWVETDLGHELPDTIHLNDALNFVYDPKEKASEKTLPRTPDHPLAGTKGRPPRPEGLQHAYFGFKCATAAPAILRDRKYAKSLAEEWLLKIRKGEAAIADASKEADNSATKARGGLANLDDLKTIDAKLLEAAWSMKDGTWAIVEGENGYHILGRGIPAK